MKDHPGLPPDIFTNGLRPLNITILYEDFASGARARHFAEQLADRFGSTCDLSRSLWRCELLNDPTLADEAGRDAADTDYLIVSLRGDTVPAYATRHWIKAQLDTANGRGAALILLSDARDGLRRAAEATRQYFRGLCADRDVPFFSLVATPPGERVTEDLRPALAEVTAEPPALRRLLLCL